jgi:hypothetical protein
VPEFPTVSLKGGPFGRVVQLEIDGKPVTASVDVTIEAKVDDVVTTTVRRITRIDVEVRSEVVDGPPVFDVRVMLMPSLEEATKAVEEKRLNIPGPQLFAQAKADTPWDALYDCGRHLELEAARRVARSGTI